MDTLVFITDSLSSMNLVTVETSSNGVSLEKGLDFVYKIAVVLIALFNLIFSIWLSRRNKKMQEDSKAAQEVKENRNNRQNLLNVLILNHKLDGFYSLFKEMNNECKKNLDKVDKIDIAKDELNSCLETLFIRLNHEFIITLRAIDTQLSDDILLIADKLQGELTKNIFDRGVNLNVVEKYQELIQTPLENAETEIIKKLYEFS